MIYVIYLRFRLLILFNITLLILLIHLYVNLHENTTIVINLGCVMIFRSLGTAVSKQVITFAELDSHLFFSTSSKYVFNEPLTPNVDCPCIANRPLLTSMYAI